VTYRMSIKVTRLNTVLARYEAIERLQRTLHDLRVQNRISDVICLLEHAPVYTLGKRGDENDFIAGTESVRAAGSDVVRVSRGGQTTYHGPGQLVAYPILNLRQLRLGVRAYVEALEDCMIAVAGRYGIEAQGRLPGRTGVWVGEGKLGAIGVSVSGSVASHGLALNVETRATTPFGAIVPCGDARRKVTCLEQELEEASAKGVAQPPTVRSVCHELAEAIAVYVAPGKKVEWITDVNELYNTLCSHNCADAIPDSSLRHLQL
jgi:lipoate-protein ligase B